MCYHCPLRRTCLRICSYVEASLPSMEAGRVDHEDLQRLYHGRIMTHALLDHMEILTQRQQQVVQLYYRENLQQQGVTEEWLDREVDGAILYKYPTINLLVRHLRKVITGDLSSG